MADKIKTEAELLAEMSMEDMLYEEDRTEYQPKKRKQKRASKAFWFDLEEAE